MFLYVCKEEELKVKVIYDCMSLDVLLFVFMVGVLFMFLLLDKGYWWVVIVFVMMFIFLMLFMCRCL